MAPTPKTLYRFTDERGSFRVDNPESWSRLYFPLVNEWGVLASITPSLQGDLTFDQHSFSSLPLVTEDLHLSRASHNFWLSFAGSKGNLWSVSGRSASQRALPAGMETTHVDAGLLWQRMTRTNKKLGVQARVLTFVPSEESTFLVMQIEIQNISAKPLSFTATSAIPIYARSADNVRDHRHVTSLLNRVAAEKYGVAVRPTMSFNERGHLINETSYYVVGADAAGAPPVGFFPTVESFVGEGGDLEQPKALLEKRAPFKKITPAHQGKETIGALQFKPTKLAPKKTASFILLIGIDRDGRTDRDTLVKRYAASGAVEKAHADTAAHWERETSKLSFHTGEPGFDAWMSWVKTQPLFRKLFGNSFLPDFDYGRGGRGWRDLWQDCLALLLADPSRVRPDLLNNFGGVRLDGSNATIITRRKLVTPQGIKWEAGFVADRNNIARTWMDHGLWPFFTTQLYLHQTGDWEFLNEDVPYFDAGPAHGSVLEHILFQTVVPFFNVGEHNIIRLLDADWNDGLDMAHDRGESVAFTAFFAGNLEAFADTFILAQEKAGWKNIVFARELAMLFDTLGNRMNYENVTEKRNRLKEFQQRISKGLSGEKNSIPIERIVADIRAKSAWIRKHLNEHEWLTHKDGGWFNGYYDNRGRRVEGEQEDGSVRMTLTGQVFPIMTGVASDDRVASMATAVNRFLKDPVTGGVRLNTDFGGIQPDLGRAFSFVYGDKENGAVFSHMVVMYANALYRRGFVKEGHEALSSLFKMAVDSKRSRIYPGLPEYFNAEGRGLYHYLTGSASWYVFTLLTQVFGVRGEAGDLLIAPKLMPHQFDRRNEARVEAWFAGSRVRITFHNPKRVPYEKIKISAVTADSGAVPFDRKTEREIILRRSALSQRADWTLRLSLS
jgi:cellobiose phosphorylase